MRAPTLLGLISLASIAASTAPPRSDGSPAFEVPFRLIAGHMFVDGFVNGKGPYLFAFDTGASGMGRADVQLVRELSLPKVGSKPNSDGVRVTPIDVVSVQSLQLGLLERRNVELLSRDYNSGRPPARPAIMGIFGADFFADELLTINFASNTLRFSRGKLAAGDPGVIPYSKGFAVNACFASVCRPAKIDTGSNRGIVIPKDLVGMLAADTPVAIGVGTRANGESRLFEMQVHQAMRVGGLTVQNPKVIYAEPSGDAIVIGSEFLKDYVLTIDSRNKLLRLTPLRALTANGE